MFLVNRSKRRVSPEPYDEDLDRSYSQEPQKGCSHIIVKDYVKMPPQNGKIVYYCNKCLSTFTFNGKKFILQYVNNGEPAYKSIVE